MHVCERAKLSLCKILLVLRQRESVWRLLTAQAVRLNVVKSGLHWGETSETIPSPLQPKHPLWWKTNSLRKTPAKRHMFEIKHAHTTQAILNISFWWLPWKNKLFRLSCKLAKRETRGLYSPLFLLLCMWIIQTGRQREDTNLLPVMPEDVLVRHFNCVQRCRRKWRSESLLVLSMVWLSSKFPPLPSHFIVINNISHCQPGGASIKVDLPLGLNSGSMYKWGCTRDQTYTLTSLRLSCSPFHTWLVQISIWSLKGLTTIWTECYKHHYYKITAHINKRDNILWLPGCTESADTALRVAFFLHVISVFLCLFVQKHTRIELLRKLRRVSLLRNTKLSLYLSVLLQPSCWFPLYPTQPCPPCILSSPHTPTAPLPLLFLRQSVS